MRSRRRHVIRQFVALHSSVPEWSALGEVTDKRTEAFLHDFVEAFEVFVAPCSHGAHA